MNYEVEDSKEVAQEPWEGSKVGDGDETRAKAWEGELTGEKETEGDGIRTMLLLGE